MSLTMGLILNLAISAGANPYATNIRFAGSVPGSSANATVYVPCELAYVSYILNEPANAGVTIEFLSETTVVRTMHIAAGQPGTLRGDNTVIWDVKNDLDDFVPLGLYRVRITAHSHGYADWTQISDDYQPGSYVWQPRGIAVNRNPSSPFYGRVFVGNGQLGPYPEYQAGDRLGVLKLNADGSPAEEGMFADGGWSWSETGNSPWKIEVAEDDLVYINDWGDHGLLLRFDQLVSSASRTVVLGSGNRPNGGAANLSGPFLSGIGTNLTIWMADANHPDGAGIRAWKVNGDGKPAADDPGLAAVKAGTNSHLSQAPFDVTLDRSNRIYTIQFSDAPGDPAPRVLRFPAYDGTVLTNADWRVGSFDDQLTGASGIAVDPTGIYVAVAFTGMGEGFGRTGGGVRVFRTADGTLVRTLTPASYHDHTDVAWDNAGNLYVCDNWSQVWRVYSPPGPNQTTTVSVPTLEAGEPPIAALLKVVAYTNAQFHFTLRGRTNINYVIQGSGDLRSWVPVLTNRDDCATRLIVVDAPQRWQFYRALAP
ncbi:MAG: hypothetical protein KJ070_13925 [Verrucomicrobia bacterium]|nr:hypothetical protein [Verrucomicrobiota bacterium]